MVHVPASGRLYATVILGFNGEVRTFWYEGGGGYCALAARMYEAANAASVVGSLKNCMKEVMLAVVAEPSQAQLKLIDSPP